VSLVCCLQSVIFCLESCVCCLWSANATSTSVESPLQINPFYAKQTQFPKKSNDVSFFYTTHYENKRNWTLGQNKPNSNPNKPNLRKAKMNVNSLITKDYRKKDDFAVRKNKPNSNPISEKPKMSANVYVIEDYENETAFRPKKTNPKQTQFTKGQNELKGS
jgi:hypothetical protein